MGRRFLYNKKPDFSGLLLFLLSKLYCPLSWIDSFNTKRVDDNLHDCEDCNHDKYSDNSPKHMLFACGTPLFIFRIPQKFNHSVNKDHHRDHEYERDKRIDDDLVNLADELVNTGIGCRNKKEIKHERLDTTATDTWKLIVRD